MNTLKHALQQKGLSVQELSVFIGNPGDYQQKQHFMAFQKRQKNNRIKETGSNYEEDSRQIEAQTVQSIQRGNVDFLA
ncbi:MAG: hypothetical protein AB2421_19135, partial [Thermotaleaceae bacterium]